VFGKSRNKVPLGVVLTLVAGCSSTPSSTVRATKVTERLNGTLSGEIQENRAVVNQVPAGTRLAVDNRLMFPGSSTQLDVRGQQLLNRVIEALFVVPKTQVVVDDCPRTPAVTPNCYLSDTRARSVVAYLREQGFDPGLLTASLEPPLVAGPGQAFPAAWDSNVTLMTITDRGP
jgi:outer membrane protein OmpA-like peptidoglycan-associated protein